jgi:hypothetical protein
MRKTAILFPAICFAIPSIAHDAYAESGSNNSTGSGAACEAAVNTYEGENYSFGGMRHACPREARAFLSSG